MGRSGVVRNRGRGPASNTPSPEAEGMALPAPKGKTRPERPQESKPKKAGWSVLGYLTAGLAATAGLGGVAIAVRTLPGRFSLTGPDGGPGDVARPRSTRQEASAAIADVIDACLTLRPDTRPQSALPVLDTAPACSYSTAETIVRAVNWVKVHGFQERKGPQVDRLFRLRFPVREQARFINAMVAVSPTLGKLVQDAHDQQVTIVWNEDVSQSSSWCETTSTVEVNALSRTTTAQAMNNPATVFQGAMQVLTTLTHELTHAAQPMQIAHPGEYPTQAAHDRALLDELADREAGAAIGELTVAREVFDATGVVLPVRASNYRCGEAQAIFHATEGDAAARFRGLREYMVRTHPAFGGAYQEMAAKRWEAGQRGKAV